MSDSTTRSFEIPAHLWAALESMSSEMNVPTAMLVNQALFSWARMNGYLEPSAIELEGAVAAPSVPREPLAPDTDPGVPPRPEPEPEPENEWVVKSFTLHDDEDTGSLGVRAFVHVGDRVVEIDSERCVVGRGADCELSIAAHGLSRQHAAIHFRDGRLELEDLGSSNGTYFNGEKVTRVALADGDEVELGDVTLRFELTRSG